MTDIDAIAKEMPRFKRLAERMELILNNPFVAGTEAERADALEDLKALREFRDKIPEFERRMESFDTLIRDVADLKNRPEFDPSLIPQQSEYAGVSEDRVKEMIDEAMRSTSAGAISPEQLDGISQRLESMSEQIETYLASQKDGDLPNRVDGLAEGLRDLREKVDAIPAGGATGSDVEQRLSVVETNLTGLMEALDVTNPDLGKDNPTPAPETPVPGEMAGGDDDAGSGAPKDPS